jgi:hypothetical protein
MKKLAMLLFVLALCMPVVDAASIDLKTAGNFGALAGSGVTNAVAGTIINGDVGSSPTPSISGLLPADVNGILYAAAGAVVEQAKLDLGDAYTAAAGATGGVPGPAELGGATILPGVYTYTTAASWTFGAGDLTLDANGDSSAQWIFQIGTTLITPANANVLLIRGASANNVFWQVGSSATLGATNTFAGNILAYTDITLGGGTLNGRALASGGAVAISGAVETINVPDYVPTNNAIRAILVYKLATAINPVIDYKDANGLEADVLKENLSAYVVFSVDDAYGVNNANDANSPTVILFGKDGSDKFKITLGGNEPNSLVNIWTFGHVNSIMPFDVTNMLNTHATSVGIGFERWAATTDFDIETFLYGKNTTMDIGLAEKLSVAKSLKGQVWFASEGQFVEGWGTANATLDTKLTKDANKNNRTVAATVANIQTTVLNIYTPVSVLP